MEMAFERERKYTLSAEHLPDMVGLGPASRPRVLRLEATYFDTPDLVLFEEGTTLRRRSGGDDDGWHLKTAAEDGARLERRMPAGGPCRVPIALRDIVAGLVEARPLVPVLRLTTVRTIRHLFGSDGDVRAEICLDRVEAELLVAPWKRSQWREVEAELSSDEPPASLDEIDRYLTDAGLRPAAHSSKAARVLREARSDTGRTAADAVRAALALRLGELQAHEVGVARDDEDSIHDTRVALRRMRSILDAFGTLVASSDDVHAARAELKWAGLQLGGARDLEVMDEIFEEALDQVRPEDAEPVATAWRAHLDAGSGPRPSTPLEAIVSPRWDAMHGWLIELATGHRSDGKGSRPAKRELRRRARRTVERVERRREAAEATPDAGPAWHEVRKAAKRARYAHEVIADLPDASTRDRNAPEVWKGVTTSLGTVQDITVARETLARIRPESAAADAFDAVDRQLAARGSEALDRARAELADAL